MENNNGKKTVVLAYSGGLDTTCILLWLVEQGYDVIAYMADLGQQEDFEEARRKALKIGAKKVIIDDLREAFVSRYVIPAFACGLIYESRYLLGTSLARPCLCEGLVRVARAEGASLLSHGATPKGNDQLRIELGCCSLDGDIKFLAPWRTPAFSSRFQGRPDLLRYAAAAGVGVGVSPGESYSVDANMLHVSYESGVLEDPSTAAPRDLYRLTVNPEDAPEAAQEVTLHFTQGLLTAVQAEDKRESRCAPMLAWLARLGGAHGLGRIDIVENRCIGLKSRGVYECPAGAILHAAHTDLEVYMLDREVLRVKAGLAVAMADCVYNGLWFSPECTYLRECLLMSQRHVTGWVRMELYKGCARPVARGSRSPLYNRELVSMDVPGGFCPDDASGFINLRAVRLREFRKFLSRGTDEV